MPIAITNAMYEHSRALAQAKLRELEFNEKQIERILKTRVGFVKAYETLVALFDSLIKSYDREDLTKMVCHSGSSKTLQAVETHTPKLKTLGLNTKAIVRLARYDGGSHNIVAVIEFETEREKLGFSIEQVVKIASQPGGRNNLLALKTLTPQMLASGYSIDQITRVASHPYDGERNLLAVIEHTPNLRRLDYSNGEITKMASTKGGHRNLLLAKDHTLHLKNLGFKHEQIIQILSYDNGAMNIQTILEKFPALYENGFSINQICKLISARNSTSNIDRALVMRRQDNTKSTEDITQELYEKSHGVYVKKSKRKDADDDIDDEETVVDERMTKPAELKFTACLPGQSFKRNRVAVTSATPASSIPPEVCQITGDIYYLPIKLFPCQHTIEAEKNNNNCCPCCQTPITRSIVDHDMLQKVTTLLSNYPLLVAKQYCTPNLIHQEILSGRNDALIIRVATARNLKLPLAAALNIRGKVNFAAGDLDRALDDANLSVCYHPSIDALYHRARYNVVAERWLLALSDINKVLETLNTRVEAFLLRANVYEALGSPKNALGDLQQVLILDPTKRDELKDRIVNLNRALSLSVKHDSLSNPFVFFEPVVTQTTNPSSPARMTKR